MAAVKTSRKELQKIFEAHQRYLTTYRALNNGSIEGATPFHVFYTYWTFTTRYSDMRVFALVTYR
jgi:hypothetical protein